MNGFKNLGIKVVFLLIDDRKLNMDGRNKIDIVMIYVWSGLVYGIILKNKYLRLNRWNVFWIIIYE